MKFLNKALVEKAREFDPFGHAGLTPLGVIRLTPSGKIKMTPVDDTAGEFFCSFENPCPGTAGFNIKNYKYDCKIKKNFEHRLIPWSFVYLYLFNTIH